MTNIFKFGVTKLLLAGIDIVLGRRIMRGTL